MSAVGTTAPAWPTERLGEAVGALARALGAEARAIADPPADLGCGNGRAPEVGRWLRAASAAAGLHSDPIDVRSTSIDSLARPGEAVLLALPEGAAGSRRFVALVGAPAANGAVAVLGPDEALAWLPAAALSRQVLGSPAARATADRVDDFCTRLGIAGPARARVGDVLGGTAGARPAQGWSLAPAELRLGARLRGAGGGALLVGTAAARVLQYALTLGAWMLVGKGALDGRLEPGWLWAWSLMLLSVVACIVVAGRSSGKLAVLLGGFCRERLVEGILGLDAEVLRSQGVGQLLGAVLETEALEALARAGGPQAMMAVIQLIAGALVLGWGASPWLNLAALGIWLCFTTFLALRHWRHLRAWADARLVLSHDLVESMVGHRTVVAQQAGQPGEDGAAFAAYQGRAATLDGAAARLYTLAPRGWLLLALGTLMPGFVSGRAASEALAISLGGVLLVYWALRQMVEAVPGLGAAALAWQRTGPLFASAPRVPPPPPVAATAADDEAAGARGLLVVRDVGFAHPGRPDPVLRGCSFAIRRGERILLTGGSGGGKSTLGSLLTGLRQPSSGALLLGGFDHHSLGPVRWRERAGGVPQFHENHILSAPLVFNVAMGRCWPPTPHDWQEIQTICRELGLGPLLDRMPAGLQQMVGDSGWQLSHGERARLFVARSLLQPLDLRVLDESFAALDPQTFEQVLDCVLRRSDTLLVVAHL